MQDSPQDFIKIVQRRDLKVNSVFKDKWNLLLLSVKYDKLEVFHYLVTREIKENPEKYHLLDALNQVPACGFNILHLCILHSSFDFLKALTHLMKNLESSSSEPRLYSFLAHLEFPTKNKLTPFLTAVQQSKADHARHLAELGCNIWAKSENLENALHFAFKNKSVELIKLVSFLDADSNKLRNQIDLKKRKPSDLDPSKQLIKCLRHPWELVKLGKLEILSKKILSGRAEINSATFKKKNTLLHLAVKYHQTAIVKFLVENGALKDLKNYKNLTPLQIATIKGDKIYASLIEGMLSSGSLFHCSSENLKPQIESKSLNTHLNKKQRSLHSIKIILPALKPNIESMSKFLF